MHSLQQKAAHPNILAFHHDPPIKGTNGQVYTIMECGDRGDLFDQLRESPDGLSIQGIHYFFVQIAAAVYHMHANGVAHLDIKPENIMVRTVSALPIGDNASGARNVADLWVQTFGEAKESGRYLQLKIGDFGHVVDKEYVHYYAGSAGYRAPEVR